MAAVTPPKYVKQILKTLQAHGHLAYLVGGCVRDIILGKRPNDWDICTSALPDEVMAIFPRSEPTGISHGTVTVHIASNAVEVTTFRSEASYTDHRHPDAVRFVCDLNTDLSRRDFTMNAIALPPDGLIADPFGGIEDIQNRLIRCVGVPQLRFEEDALRMFRAIRFSARLDFEIEPSTMAAIREKSRLAMFLAPERIRDEVEKTFLTDRPQKLADIIRSGLLDGYFIRRPDDMPAMEKLAFLPRNSSVRWAAISYLLENCGAISSAEEFLAALRLDNRTIRLAAAVSSILASGIPADTGALKRLLRDHSVDAVSCAAQCADAFFGRRANYRAVKAVLKSGECFSVKYLAVTGDDLISIGFRGRGVGDMLALLLDNVIEHPENNRRELLLGIARTAKEKQIWTLGKP